MLHVLCASDNQQLIQQALQQLAGEYELCRFVERLRQALWHTPVAAYHRQHQYHAFLTKQTRAQAWACCSMQKGHHRHNMVMRLCACLPLSPGLNRLQAPHFQTPCVLASWQTRPTGGPWGSVQTRRCRPGCRRWPPTSWLHCRAATQTGPGSASSASRTCGWTSTTGPRLARSCSGSWLTSCCRWCTTAVRRWQGAAGCRRGQGSGGAAAGSSPHPVEPQQALQGGVDKLATSQLNCHMCDSVTCASHTT